MILLFLLSDTLSVKYKAERIEYIVSPRKVVLTGNARIDYGKLYLTADTIVYLPQDKKLIAWGHPFLFDGEREIYAERMVYDLEEKTGWIFNARAKVEKGYLYAKKAKYIKDEKVIKIKGGYFTTCELDPPHYYFYSTYMRVNINDMVIARPVILLVQDIPLFWLPFWYFPIKKERSSGLLPFKIGKSSTCGRYLKGYYYLVLGPHADATLGAELYEKKGIMGSLEARWLLSREILDGNMNARYVREKDTGKRRWELNLNHASRFLLGARLKANASLRSDKKFITDYYSDTVEVFKTHKEWEVSLSRRIGRFSGNLVFDYDESPEGIVKKKFPEFFLSIPTYTFGPIHISSSFRFLRNESDERITSYSVSPSFTRSLFRYFPLSFSGEYRGEYHVFQDTSFLKDEKSVRASIRTTFYGLSNFGIYPFERFRSVYTPSVSFSYSFPSQTSPWGKKTFGWSLRYVLQAKREDKKYDLLTANFSGSYLFEDTTWSDIQVSMTTGMENLRGELSGKIKKGDFTLQKFSLRIKFRDWNADLSWNPKTPAFTGGLSGRLKLTPRWTGNFTGRYDFLEGELVSARLSLTRDLHCWELRLSWNMMGENQNLEISLHLKRIPEIKIEKGIFEELLP